MSSIAAVQAGIGYLRAPQRDGCARCVHAVFDTQAYERGERQGVWRCERYGFLTSTLAICNQFTRRQFGAAEAQESRS